jgi:tryptophan-rich sensory protein
MNNLTKLRLNYLLIPLFVLITASAASYFAETGKVWYETIQLPDWTPPGSIMVLAWAAIFILSAVSLLLFWNRNYKDKKFNLIIGQFILNAILVVSWNIIFFTYQQIAVSFFYAILLVANILFLVILIWPICRISAFLLIPYSLWVIFATLLTLNVWMIN